MFTDKNPAIAPAKYFRFTDFYKICVLVQGCFRSTAFLVRPQAFSHHCRSLTSQTLTHERGSGQAAIVELCNLDGFDDVTSSGAYAGDCLYTRYMWVLTHA